MADFSEEDDKGEGKPEEKLVGMTFNMPVEWHTRFKISPSSIPTATRPYPAPAATAPNPLACPTNGRSIVGLTNPAPTLVNSLALRTPKNLDLWEA